MKTLFLAISILLTNLSNGQTQGVTPNSEKETIKNTIEVSSSLSAQITPDSYTISLTISEYVRVDPETQHTTAKSLQEVENTLLDKLKKFSIKKDGLKMINVFETIPNNYNLNYNNTQKRLLKKVYQFNWKDKTRIEEIIVSLRFNGVDHISVASNFNDTKNKSIVDELIKKSTSECKNKAEEIAANLGVTLGEISSFSFDQLNSNNPYIYQYNYNQYGAYQNTNANLSEKTETVHIRAIFSIKK